MRLAIATDCLLFDKYELNHDRHVPGIPQKSISLHNGCYDQLRQMLRTGQAVLIKILVFCQDLKGYHLQFLAAMSLYYGEAGMRIERCKEDCYDLCNLQAAGEQLSLKFQR